MKLFEDFLNESESLIESQEVLDKISSAWGRKHRGLNVDASMRKSGDIRLNNIWVPPDKRGKGVGGRVMKGLSTYADKQKKRITLNQAPEPGKKKKLGDFYKSNGFEANRGKNKDHSVSDTHIRNPKTK